MSSKNLEENKEDADMEGMGSEDLFGEENRKRLSSPNGPSLVCVGVVCVDVGSAARPITFLVRSAERVSLL